MLRRSLKQLKLRPNYSTSILKREFSLRERDPTFYKLESASKYHIKSFVISPLFNTSLALLSKYYFLSPTFYYVFLGFAGWKLLKSTWNLETQITEMRLIEDNEEEIEVKVGVMNGKWVRVKVKNFMDMSEYFKEKKEKHKLEMLKKRMSEKQREKLGAVFEGVNAAKDLSGCCWPRYGYYTRFLALGEDSAWRYLSKGYERGYFVQDDRIVDIIAKGDLDGFKEWRREFLGLGGEKDVSE